MRRLLVLTSSMIFFDVAFFAAIAPLLPGFVDELGLTEAEAGILSASYAAGTLVAALPAGYVASRIGPRTTVVVGLTTLGFSSLVFGLVHDFYPLLTSRFVQGISGALIWAGALTWLISATPPERRGSAIGTALGTAIAGALLGPVLGAAAASIGTGPVFSGVLVVTTALSYLALRTPDAAPPERQPPREIAATLLSRPIRDATFFVAVPSIMFGAIEVLVPLRIDALGGGHGVIAAGFIAGAATEAALSPVAGRMSDRIGRRAPYVVGLTICAFAMVAVGLAQALGSILAALVVTSLGAGLCFAPAMTLIADLAERSRLHQGFAAGLSNMAWAAGQVIGGVVGGALATVTGYAAPSIGIAVLLLLTVAYAMRSLVPAALPRPPG